MIVVYLLILVVLSLVLIKSADYVVVSIKRLSSNIRIGTFGVSAIILTLGTSFPELFVGITSSLEGKPGLSLGVIVGSNISNLALIAASATLLVGRVRVHGDHLKKSVVAALIAGILPFILILDKTLNTVDGIILLFIYFAYVFGFFNSFDKEIIPEEHEHTFIYRFIQKINDIKRSKTKDVAKLFLGVALMLFSADMIVKTSSNFAELINAPIFVIGLVVLAVGTSLPEFAFALRSLKDREPLMFFGNILGSIVVNSTLIIGISAIINPIKISSIEDYLIAGIAFVTIFLFFWFFIHSKRRLDRWEALLLVVLYVTFLILEFTV